MSVTKEKHEVLDNDLTKGLESLRKRLADKYNRINSKSIFDFKRAENYSKNIQNVFKLQKQIKRLDVLIFIAKIRFWSESVLLWEPHVDDPREWSTELQKKESE